MIPVIETKSKEEIFEYQNKKLSELLSYVQEKSPYYKRIFKENSIDIASIKSLSDIHKLPLTTKKDLQLYNDDFLCVDKSEVVDYVTTSGTTGKVVTFCLTDKDLDRLAYNEAISFACSKVTKEDTIQLMTTIDRRFMAGIAYFLGARKLGAGIIRVGAGLPELQWDSIQKFKPTYVIAVPSFLLKLIEYAEKHNIDYKNSSIKGAICIGESLRNQDFTHNVLSNKIRSKWNIELFSTYASTEMSTAFSECEFQVGGHQHPELIITEIVDENDHPVSNGKEGELVITTLGVEAMPLLRFKTGDIVKMHTDNCECGRNTPRVGPVMGRKKQMIKYKGTTIYPPAMYNLLNDFSEVKNYVIEIDNNEIGTDKITIKIGLDKSPPENLLSALKNHFRAKLRVSPEIEFSSTKEVNSLKIDNSGRKYNLFIDRRKSNAN